MLSILAMVGCNIDPDNIESCHQLSKKSDKVIIIFLKRKFRHHVRRVKNFRKNLNVEHLALSRENKSEINRNLCQYYCILWFKSKSYSFFIVGESIKIKAYENNAPQETTRGTDFEYHLPDIDLVPTSTSNY